MTSGHVGVWFQSVAAFCMYVRQQRRFQRASGVFGLRLSDAFRVASVLRELGKKGQFVCIDTKRNQSHYKHETVAEEQHH